MFRIIGVVLLFSILLSCNTGASEEAGSKPFRIVCTTGMLGDAIRRMVKEEVVVESLMGPGVDPHLYKATEGDLRKLTEADLIVYNGLHLEGKMMQVLEKLGRQKSVLAAAETVPDERIRKADGNEDAADPHIWFDVELWKMACVGMQSSIRERHPEVIDPTATEAFLSQLDSLNARVSKRISEIPAERRVLITAHDAFGYFGDQYGIEVHGLQGISTVAEYGVRDVTELVDFITSRRIPAVFVESSVSARSMEAVREACQRRGFDLRIGGTLYSDAMGEAGTPEGTYIGMVEHNLNTIVEALKP